MKQFGAVEHPVEVRDALLRAIAMVDQSDHPFWARGFAGPAAVRKLACALYVWLTGISPDPHRDEDARGEFEFGRNATEIRVAASIVPVPVAELVERAMTAAGSDALATPETFAARLTDALLEAAVPDARGTDVHRRLSTQELIDTSVKMKRPFPRAQVEDEEFRSPWKRVADGDALKMALKLELPDDHVLAGRAVQPVARRSGSSEVLFELIENAPVVAVVHLRWAPPLADQPHLPWTRLFADMGTWRVHCMEVDHALWFRGRPTSSA